MNDYNILKITGKRQLKALFYFICGLILYIGIFIYFKIDDRIFIMIVVAPLLIFTQLPTIFLHIEYLTRNKGEEYELCGERIVQHKEDKEFIYYKEDIKKIEVYVSPNYFNNEIYFTTYANYHYAKVYLKSGEILYLTSLLAPGGIDKVLSTYLKDIPYRKVKRIFATTLY